MERELVFRLIRKANELRKFEDVISVFYLPNLPGRLYFEAKSPSSITRLCQEMLWLYAKSLFTVELGERVSLMRTRRSNPSIEEGSWVKVKNGLYRGDIGLVVSVVEDQDAIVVKLKCREAHPTSNEFHREVAEQPANATANSTANSSSHAPATEATDGESQRKRKRKRSRPEAYTLEVDRTRPSARKPPQLIDGTKIKLTNEGFTLRGLSYSRDGFRLVEFRCDRVEKVRNGIAGFNTYIRSELANATNQHHSERSAVDQNSQDSLPTQTFTPNSTAVSLPLFLNVGNHVIISKGASEGSQGIIVSMTPDFALISLDDPGSASSDTVGQIETEVDVNNLIRLFDFGERVEVMVGELIGRTGIVGDIQGTVLSVVDEARNDVASKFTFPYKTRS